MFCYILLYISFICCCMRSLIYIYIIYTYIIKMCYWFCSDLYIQKMMIKKFMKDSRHAQRKLGWTLCGPKYCQLIWIPNQFARLEFCNRCVAEKKSFDNMIFTDESTIMLDKHGKIFFRKKQRLPKLKPNAKHPYKVCTCLGRNIKERDNPNIDILGNNMHWQW